MFKLNFKIALRNIWKNKTSSLINISGLAIGLAACLLLLLYVAYEWNYDRQTIDPDSTYKVLMNMKDASKKITGTMENTNNIIAPLLKSEYPGIKAITRIAYGGKKLIANGKRSIKRVACYADPDILNIYAYTFIYGDIRSSLAEPKTVVVTESTAKALFGTTDVLNRTVRYDEQTDLKVTGVIKDLPGNTSIQFDLIMPWSLNVALNPYLKEAQWGSFNYFTLVRMDPNTDISQLNLHLKGFLYQHNTLYDGELWLCPLSRLHLYDTFVNGKSVGGRIEQLRLFMGLAIGILLIACVNFMNMATAKSEKRAKEVGIKKTIGATRYGLISQFLMESMVLTLLSSVMAIVLIELCIPLFNNLLDIHLVIDYSNINIWFGLAAVVLLTGFISGSYPAFYLSSFNPIQIFKKQRLKGGILSISLRQVLVVGQFCFAIVLIISTAVIYKQIQYLKDRPIGYQVNGLIEVQQEGLLPEKYDLLKEKLLGSGAVKSMYKSSGTISNQTSTFTGMKWKGSSEADTRMVFAQITTTYDFVKTTGVKLVEGRDFSEKFASDSAGILLSRSAVKQMNLSHPVGQTVLYQTKKSTVVGVFDDFILGDPAFKGTPLVVAFVKGWSATITMKLNMVNKVTDNLATVENIVKEINPDYPVEINFVDQLYAEKLKDQKVLGILSNLFGGLAIFISCLGLFGLAAYSAEQRTKEIGVRKVLGASVTSLMQLLSVSFLKMVLIAIVIAVPIASYIMNNWLQNFEFHTVLSWLIIAMAAAGTIGIALLTVSYQAYKAANTNPVDALKYE